MFWPARQAIRRGVSPRFGGFGGEVKRRLDAPGAAPS